MADDATLFRSRAALEQANADAATLLNVRERCERAAKAWTEMADRAERVTTQRREREEQTASTRPDPTRPDPTRHGRSPDQIIPSA